MMNGDDVSFEGTRGLQKAEIEFHRGIFKIRPVELHEFPFWAMQRLCALGGGWGHAAADSAWQKMDGYYGSNVALLDHWGRSVVNKTHTLVTEPYQSVGDEKVVKQAIQLADMLGCHVLLCDKWDSWWYPGQTCRIEFFLCKDGNCSRSTLRHKEVLGVMRDRRKQLKRLNQQHLLATAEGVQLAVQRSSGYSS